MSSVERFLSGLACLALAATCAPSAFAAASSWFAHEHGAVRLVGGAAGGDEVDLGLQFRMKPGWKIYWRSPGDAGFPPQANWAGSVNLARAELAWPSPERFSVLGLETLGYRNEVVLPITASPFDPGKEMALRARVRFLTCNDVCVPYETDLALALPSGANAREAALIDRWRARVPSSGGGGPLSIDRIELAGRTLAVVASAEGGFGKPDLFVEGPPGFRFGRPDVASTGATATMRMDVQPPGNARLEGREATLTLVDGDRAIERRVTLPRAPPQAPGFLFAILGLALLGGLILNLMPCVLPVLSLKLMTVIDHGGESQGRVRAGFVASAAGILACFAILGTVAVGLKAAGLAAGWGIQFQQPVFVTFMAAVIVLFACNMWGFFEIRLPGAVAGAASGETGRSLRGHFLTGAFATLLATPCTAPFLGTAVGFALARGVFEIYAVFLAVGLGLALPWLLVAGFPVLVKHLPKPGSWMATVKRVLSFALIGTAAWLLSVLWFQIGGPGAVMVALLLGAMAFATRQYRDLGGRARLAAGGTAAFLATVSMAGAGAFSVEGPSVAKNAPPWRPFDAARIGAEVASGRSVLVDVTADWCLTCQINKSLVLERGRVAELLGGGGVVAMRADWTSPDDRIAAYLESFGRFGIPFNVVHGPAAPGGVVLPEILSASAVLKAVDEAGGASAGGTAPMPVRAGRPGVTKGGG